jgi:hypothetical protein
MSAPGLRALAARARWLAPHVAAWAALRVGAGLALGVPLSALAASVVGAWPDGDRRLSHDDVLLVELARVVSASRGPLVAGAGAVLAATTLLALLPFAATLSALATRASLGASLGRGLGLVPPLVLLSGVALALEAALFAALSFGGGAVVSRVVSASVSPRQQDLAMAAVLVVAALAVLALGVVHDLVRASLPDAHGSVRRALRSGLRAGRRAPGRAAASYLCRVGGGLALALVFARASLGLLRGGAPSVVGAGLVGVVSVLALVSGRVLWLSRALELVREHGLTPDQRG